MESWSSEIESLLDKIRQNCILLSNKHTTNHLFYKNANNYFDIPIIILSVFAGSFSVGSDTFLHQELISVVNCVISMIITILTSIKLYMKITESATQEYELAIGFKTLALDVFKILYLPTNARGTDGIQYLNKSYSKYLNLIENSHIISKTSKKDQLLAIDPRLLRNDDNSISSDNSNDRNPLSIDTPVDDTL